MKEDIAHEAAKAAPPVVVTGSAWLFSFTLNDWVLVITGLYVSLQAAYLVWKWIKEVRSK